MARREGSALVWQKTDERLKEAVREAFEIAPLPNPPLELPDFPAISPCRFSIIGSAGGRNLRNRPSRIQYAISRSLRGTFTRLCSSLNRSNMNQNQNG